MSKVFWRINAPCKKPDGSFFGACDGCALVLPEVTLKTQEFVRRGVLRGFEPFFPQRPGEWLMRYQGRALEGAHTFSIYRDPECAHLSHTERWTFSGESAEGTFAQRERWLQSAGRPEQRVEQSDWKHASERLRYFAVGRDLYPCFDLRVQDALTRVTVPSPGTHAFRGLHRHYGRVGGSVTERLQRPYEPDRFFESLKRKKAYGVYPKGASEWHWPIVQGDGKPDIGAPLYQECEYVLKCKGLTEGKTYEVALHCECVDFQSGQREERTLRHRLEATSRKALIEGALPTIRQSRLQIKRVKIEVC